MIILLVFVEITLMDANYFVDEFLSTRSINISELPVFNETVKQRVSFNEVRNFTNVPLLPQAVASAAEDGKHPSMKILVIFYFIGVLRHFQHYFSYIMILG